MYGAALTTCNMKRVHVFARERQKVCVWLCVCVCVCVCALPLSFQVANILFRMGGAAMLLSNKTQAWPDAKYKLTYTHKVHLGSSDDAYK